MGNSSIFIYIMIKEYNGNFTGTTYKPTGIYDYTFIHMYIRDRILVILPFIWRDRKVAVESKPTINSLKIYFD